MQGAMENGDLMIGHWKELDEFQKNMTYRQPDEFWTDEAKTRFAAKQALALFMEVAELTDSFQWKPWRDHAGADIPNLEREIVDCLFFLHHIAAAFDIKPEDLDKRFYQVLNNNKRRYVANDFSGEDEA